MKREKSWTEEILWGAMALIVVMSVAHDLFGSCA